MIVYIITNIKTGGTYIGKTTKTASQRYERHWYLAESGSETHLHRAMRNGCHSHFNIEVLESQVPEGDLSDREQYWIEKLSPTYNMTTGGEGGDTSDSPNIKRSMEEYHANKPREEYATYGFKGKRHSPAARRKTAEAKWKPVRVKGIDFPSIEAACLHYEIGRTTYYRWKDKVGFRHDRELN